MSRASEQDIKNNLRIVRDQILQLSVQSGRTPPRLIAVSKVHPASAILTAYEAGQRDFGENYSQELVEKRTQLAALKDLRFAFIGRIQSNKIKSIVLHADEIQSLSDLKHAALIAKAAYECGKAPYPVYYLVNAGDEPTKTGLKFLQIDEFHTQICKNFPELSPQGLMAIPPHLAEDDFKVPELYIRLKNKAATIGLGKLSLGMSDDLRPAIFAGSDCVRIGTAIFGARIAPDPKG
jgi:pyridoxal phosphate enzyme (YggS family)